MRNCVNKKRKIWDRDLKDIAAEQIKHLGVTDDAEDVPIEVDVDWKGEG